MKRLVLAALACLAAVASVASGAPTARAAGSGLCTNSSAPAHYAHVVWIVMENRSYGQVIGHAPYLDSLAAQCGSAQDMHNITHPSLPNYLAMTSGRALGSLPTTDCAVFCPVGGPSIFGENASWDVFAESMPSACLRRDSGPYRVHHTAAPYYSALTGCGTKDLPLSAMKASALPRFTLISPNIYDDMHENSSSVSAGDTWLKNHLPALLGSYDYQAGRTAIFITWDEGGLIGRTTNSCATSTTDAGCHIPTLLLAKAVAPGTRPAAPLTLYGLLRATEEMLGYPLLGKAATAASLRAAFSA